MPNYADMLAQRAASQTSERAQTQTTSDPPGGSMADMLMRRASSPVESAEPKSFDLKTTSTGVAPLTSSAFSNSQRNLVSSQGQPIHLRPFSERNKSGDVTIDTESGVGGMTRFGVSVRRDEGGQRAYLEDQFGAGNVRVADNGEWIVRIPGGDGKPVDVTVNPHGVDWTDFAGVAASTPEILGAVAAAMGARNLPSGGLGKLGKVKGLGGLFRDAFAEAFGGAVAGGITDAAVRGYDGRPIDLGEIASSRTKSGMVDLAGGMILGWGGRFLKRTAKSPFPNNRGQIEFDALEAQRYFNDKYGVDVPLSIGQETGSPLIMRLENFLSEQPGAEGMKKFFKGQEGKMLEIQARMVGKVAPDEALGKAVTRKLSSVSGESETAVLKAELSAKRAALAEIEKAIGDVTSHQRTMSHAKVGAALRGSVKSLKEIADAKSRYLYNYAKGLEGGTGRVLPTGRLSKDAQAILDDLPKDVRVIESPTELFDASGAQIMRPSKKTEVLGEFVPPNVLARLKRLKGLDGQSMSLSELQQMRREVYDDIAKGEAVPGLGTHYLNKIGKSITAAIEEGIDSIPNPQLRKAWKDANRFYKEQVIPYNRSGIAEMFTDPNTAGHVGDSQLASMFLSGPKSADRLFNLRSILGAKSVEYGSVKRMIADHVVDGASKTSDGIISGESLGAMLDSFRRSSPDVFNEVFGPNAKKIMSAVSSLKAVGDEIPEAEVKRLLLQTKSEGLLSIHDSIVDLAKKRAADKELASNRIINAIRGKDASKIKPSEFVDIFIDSGKPEDVRQVLDLIKDNPALVEQVERKVVQKVLRNASRPATPTDVSRMLTGDNTRIVSAKGIAAQLGDEKKLGIYREILDEGRFDELLQYLSLEASNELRRESFRAAGGIAAGMTVSRILSSGIWAAIPKAAKHAAQSILLTNKPIRKWAALLPPDDPGAMMLIFTSPQFARAVVDEFGQGSAADEFIDSLRDGVMRYTESHTQTNQPPATGQ